MHCKMPKLCILNRGWSEVISHSIQHKHSLPEALKVYYVLDFELKFSC